MAWNESRIWMVAPGWKPEVERLTDPPVSIISFAPDPEALTALPPDRSALAIFFKQHGLFRKDPEATIFEGGAIEAILEEPDPGAGVCSIRLTFTIWDPFKKLILVHDHKAQWSQIVASLAGSFGFRIVDPDSLEATDDQDLLKALRKTQACEGIEL